MGSSPPPAAKKSPDPRLVFKDQVQFPPAALHFATLRTRRMTFGYTINEQRKIIFLRFSGSFDAANFLACIERLWADPAYQREFEGIADITDVSPTYTIADLRRVIAFLRDNHRTNTARWALITSSPLAAACGYVYQKAMSPVHRLEVFSTWEAASAFVHWNADRPALREHVMA